MNPFQDLTDEDISIDNLKKILSVEKLLEYLAVIRDDTEWTKQNCPFFYNKPFLHYRAPVPKEKQYSMLSNPSLKEQYKYDYVPYTWKVTDTPKLLPIDLYIGKLNKEWRYYRHYVNKCIICKNEINLQTNIVGFNVYSEPLIMHPACFLKKNGSIIGLPVAYYRHGALPFEINSIVESAARGIDKIRFFHSPLYRTLFNSECEKFKQSYESLHEHFHCSICFEDINCDDMYSYVADKNKILMHETCKNLFHVKCLEEYKKTSETQQIKDLKQEIDQKIDQEIANRTNYQYIDNIVDLQVKLYKESLKCPICRTFNFGSRKKSPRRSKSRRRRKSKSRRRKSHRRRKNL